VQGWVDKTGKLIGEASLEDCDEKGEDWELKALGSRAP